jgi:hypothetical protein
MWLSETQIGAEKMKARLTLTLISPTAYTFKFETSPDGVTWKTALEGRDRKK